MSFRVEFRNLDNISNALSWRIRACERFLATAFNISRFNRVTNRYEKKNLKERSLKCEYKGIDLKLGNKRSTFRSFVTNYLFLLIVSSYINIKRISMNKLLEELYCFMNLSFKQTNVLICINICERLITINLITITIL